MIPSWCGEFTPKSTWISWSSESISNASLSWVGYSLIVFTCDTFGLGRVSVNCIFTSRCSYLGIFALCLEIPCSETGTFSTYSFYFNTISFVTIFTMIVLVTGCTWSTCQVDFPSYIGWCIISTCGINSYFIFLKPALYDLFLISK